MTRLPQPGKDIGTWGGILNDFLTTAHNPDGSLKSSALRILDGSITTPQLADNAVTDSKLDVATQTTLATVASKYTKPAGGVPLTDLSNSLRANLAKAGTSVQQVNNKTPDGSGALTLTAADVGAATTLGGLSDVNATGATNSQVLSYNTGSSKWTAATVTSTTVSDASNTGKGILQLAGDLAGSNDPTNPTISTGAITDAKVATGAAISQSKIQNLTTNLAAKAPLASPTFSGTVTVPTPANPTDATTKGYVDSQVTTGSTPDATPTTKGKIQLAGDLAGTAASPTVAKLSGVSLAGLATGLLKNTTGTGVPSIATASDIPDLSATYATTTALTTEVSTARTAESKAVPRWAPTTTYTLGQQVVSPNNDVVSAIAGFTSGASYVPANWAVSSTFAPIQTAPVSGAQGVYDWSKCAYNLKPKHLRRTRAALGKARSGLGLARFGYIGDSVTVGELAVVGSQGYPEALQDMLEVAGIPRASRWVSAWQAEATETRWSVGAGWAPFANTFSNSMENSTTTNPLTLTTTETATGIRVWYFGVSSPFTVSIDGGTATPITPTGAATLQSWTSGTLANTTHTITFVRTSGDVYVTYVEVIQAPAGTVSLNAAISGMNTAQVHYDFFGHVGGVMATAFNADLMFVNLAINDFAGGYTLTQYQTYMQAVITGLGSRDIILLSPAPWATGGAFDPTYRQVLYNLADVNDLPLLDTWDRWGSYALANAGGIMGDTAHPNAAGYADIARMIYSAIAP
jgi:hypothetical protein